MVFTFPENVGGSIAFNLGMALAGVIYYYCYPDIVLMNHSTVIDDIFNI